MAGYLAVFEKLFLWMEVLNKQSQLLKKKTLFKIRDFRNLYILSICFGVWDGKQDSVLLDDFSSFIKM